MCEAARTRYFFFFWGPLELQRGIMIPFLLSCGKVSWARPQGRGTFFAAFASAEAETEKGAILLSCEAGLLGKAREPVPFWDLFLDLWICRSRKTFFCNLFWGLRICRSRKTVLFLLSCEESVLRKATGKDTFFGASDLQKQRKGTFLLSCARLQGQGAFSFWGGL